MSTYCTQANIEATYGVTNVQTWAKLESGYSAAQITARIDRAIAVASEDIDDTLRFAGFEVPCVDGSGATPTTIEQLCADLAGVWLYESRGVVDIDKAGQPIHKLQYFAERAQRRLEEISQRRRKINTASNTG